MGDNFSDYVRSLPPWLLFTVGGLLVLILIGSLPLAGYLLERRRRREAAMAIPLVGSGWGSFFYGQPDRGSQPKPQKFGALDVTFAGKADSSPTTIVTVVPERREAFMLEDTPETWPPVEEPRPDVEEDNEVISIEIDDDRASELHGVPRWAEMTAEWTVVEDWESELMESEAQAIADFQSDPLGAWYVPPAVIDQSAPRYLPEADRAFTNMILSGRLTGEGSDIDAEWHDWYSNEMEMAR